MKLCMHLIAFAFDKIILLGGHYTSKCLNYINDKWYHFDDSRVTEVSRMEVERSQSYVLFYRYIL